MADPIRSFFFFGFASTQLAAERAKRDNVVYWKETNWKINNDLQCQVQQERAQVEAQ